MKRALTLAFLLSLLMLSFQNCGVSQPLKFSEDEKSASTDGNGQGYDGKVYVLTGELCPDASNIRSKIILKSAISGSLVRKDCQDITPLALTANDFQINLSNPDELTYLSQVFLGQIPFGGVAMDLAKAYAMGGFSYYIAQNFGTTPDALDTTATRTQSALQIYENGVALGPAHSAHADILNLGLGRFSHWYGSGEEGLYWSASDNTNPLTNGRVYSYKILK